MSPIRAISSHSEASYRLCEKVVGKKIKVNIVRGLIRIGATLYGAEKKQFDVQRLGQRRK